MQIDHEEAGEMARQLAREEGILCGISVGGNVYAAVEQAKRPENEGKLIVTIVCETGERYLSTWLFEEEIIKFIILTFILMSYNFCINKVDYIFSNILCMITDSF